MRNSATDFFEEIIEYYSNLEFENNKQAALRLQRLHYLTKFSTLEAHKRFMYEFLYLMMQAKNRNASVEEKVIKELDCFGTTMHGDRIKRTIVDSLMIAQMKNEIKQKGGDVDGIQQA